MLVNTVETILNHTINLFNYSNYRELEWLLAYALGWSRTKLITNYNYQLNNDQQLIYEKLLFRYSQGEPLAYLLGSWEFWSLELIVSPAVLIPRPETELLVEIALNYIAPQNYWKIADLGTGSGAIALALAKERQFCHITATDYSNEALFIAQKNAHVLNIKNIGPLNGDWFNPLLNKKFNLIVTNPPYLEDKDHHLDSLKFEPKSALIAGIDGLDAIRTIAADAINYLDTNGIIIIEHGYNQGAAGNIFNKLKYLDISTYQDLEKRERVTTAIKNN